MSSKKKQLGATAPPASPLKIGTLVKRFALPVFWVLVVVTVLRALMHYSTPQSNLETYTKFKETAAPAQEETQPAPVDLEKISRWNFNVVAFLPRVMEFDMFELPNDFTKVIQYTFEVGGIGVINIYWNNGGVRFSLITRW